MSDRESLLVNLNIESQQPLPTPAEIHEELPLSSEAAKTAGEARRVIGEILSGEDPRLLVVVGPCSIHDSKAAVDYAERLATLREEVGDSLFLVMRVYFEKPRTSVGWKGFINDPYLDDTFRIDEGLRRGRKLLLAINDLGVPVGTEALDPLTPQYFDDLISWTAIGARTVESQTHRELASGLSTPVGFKNGTNGSIDVAVNALKAVSQPHHFLGVNRNGRCSVFQSRGNQHAHVVLRGGEQPNYDSVHVALSEQALKDAGLPLNLMVDCSHGNSLKDPKIQPLVLEDCVSQIAEGNTSIMGVMIESHIKFGNQKLTSDKSALEYGVSITDACIDWKTTVEVLKRAQERLKEPLLKRVRH